MDNNRKSWFLKGCLLVFTKNRLIHWYKYSSTNKGLDNPKSQKEKCRIQKKYMELSYHGPTYLVIRHLHDY